MSFEKGHTTFGFTMRVPDSDEAAVDDIFASHAAWMADTHSLKEEIICYLFAGEYATTAHNLNAINSLHVIKNLI